MLIFLIQLEHSYFQVVHNQIHSLAFRHQLRNTKRSRRAMDEIEAGYTTPPNHEDSEQVADSDQSEQDEQGEKGAKDKCEASEEECDMDGDEDEEEEAGRKRIYERGRRAWSELAVYDRTLYRIPIRSCFISASPLALANKVQKSGLI